MNLCFDGLFGLLRISDEIIAKVTPSLDIMFKDISKMVSGNSNLPYRELGSRFLTTLLEILLKHKIKINSESSAIFKAMATTDAVYTTVCPDYSISNMLEIVVDISQVFIQKLILQESKIIDYSINIIDKDQKIREFLLTKFQTEIGKEFVDIITKPFVAKDFASMTKPSVESRRFFGMVEEIENLWLSSKTRQY
jgi:hypothetical protein